MLLELVPGGELFSLLRSVVRFEETQARTSTRPADPLARPTHLAHLRTRSRAQAMLYAGMVTCAFGYLHARKIAHRDLKPENLLFDKDGYLKLVDFGFAKVIKDRTWTLCGTPEYLAPEIISNKGHNMGADWCATRIGTYTRLTT